MKWILFIIALWIFLTLDFLISFDEVTHAIIHIIVGTIGSYFIYTNRKKFK